MIEAVKLKPPLLLKEFWWQYYSLRSQQSYCLSAPAYAIILSNGRLEDNGNIAAQKRLPEPIWNFCT
jgi:hypothetical protein